MTPGVGSVVTRFLSSARLEPGWKRGILPNSQRGTTSRMASECQTRQAKQRNNKPVGSYDLSPWFSNIVIKLETIASLMIGLDIGFSMFQCELPSSAAHLSSSRYSSKVMGSASLDSV